eukprot:GHVP01059874.1.p2 GENE.GHVP01059874.1~~GHVP01059874.1.p2  ORF type:complete len:465 (+),score=90.12 GHVP01059874.1:30-1424(+)
MDDFLEGCSAAKNSIQRALWCDPSDPVAQRWPKTVSLESSIAKLQQAIELSSHRGSSNGVLVCGPTGSGKTVLVTEAFARCKNGRQGSFEILWLHCQAMRQTSSFKSLYTKLQGILENEDNDGTPDCNSGVQRMDIYVELIAKQLEESRTCLVIVLEEAQYLCENDESQQFLYCCFDWMHLPSATFTVILLTSQQDLQKHMEKRVKSRVALCRRIPLHLCTSSEAWMNFLKNVLTTKTTTKFKDFVDYIFINRQFVDHCESEAAFGIDSRIFLFNVLSELTALIVALQAEESLTVSACRNLHFRQSGGIDFVALYSQWKEEKTTKATTPRETKYPLKKKAHQFQDQFPYLPVNATDCSRGEHLLILAVSKALNDHRNSNFASNLIQNAVNSKTDHLLVWGNEATLRTILLSLLECRVLRLPPSNSKVEGEGGTPWTSTILFDNYEVFLANKTQLSYAMKWSFDF